MNNTSLKKIFILIGSFNTSSKQKIDKVHKLKSDNLSVVLSVSIMMNEKTSKLYLILQNF